MEKNTKIIIGVTGVISVALVGYVGYQYYLYNEHERLAQEYINNHPGMTGGTYSSIGYTFSKFLTDAIMFKKHPGD